MVLKSKSVLPVIEPIRLCLQVRGGVNGQLFSLANEGNTRSVTEGITQRGGAEVVYRSFSSIPKDIYYWVLPQSFQGDKVRVFLYNVAGSP